MSEVADRIKHEFLLWLHYFFASLVAAIVAHERYMHAYYGSPSGAPQSPNEINIDGLVAGLWRDYYRWWFAVFIGFSLVRVAYLFISFRLKKRKGAKLLG